MFRVWRFAGIEYSVVFITFYEHAKTHKASCKKYKPYILKYKALISKYMPYIFRNLNYLINNKFCVFTKRGVIA